ncbi:MAG TPA: flagellar hook-length control protein FliK [Caulobacteraceae bacterium]|nr:flagellar hook-length control protein FliK [Caulobacteraceae bacterium]
MSTPPISPAGGALATQALLDSAAMRLADALDLAGPAAPPAAAATPPPPPAPAPPAATVAAQAAVTQQASLAPALADIAAALAGGELPAPVAAAAARVAALATPLDPAPSGEALKAAAGNSGLMLEPVLAATGAPPPADLKAALLALRQALQTAAPALSAAEPALLAQPPLTPAQGLAQNPPLVLEMHPAPAGPVALPSPEQAPPPAQAAIVTGPATPPPPPPYRDGPLTPQPPAAPSVDPAAPPAAIAHALLAGVTGALARQLLSQLASLPDAPHAPGQAAAPQWSFEIPVTTPQGPAILPLRISRDGGGVATPGDEAPVWRARFALDAPGGGTVHASVSLRGGHARVGLWAEQPEMAAALDERRASLAQDLAGQALDAAVTVFPGQPPVALAGAGRFVDRAL